MFVVLSTNKLTPLEIIDLFGKAASILHLIVNCQPHVS